MAALREAPDAREGEEVLEAARTPIDRSAEFCGAHDRHDYGLYLAVKDIDHTRTKTRRPQINGM